MLVSVVGVGVLFIAVFPTQTYLNQRAEAEERTEELAEIEQRNAELQERIDQLNDPAYIELWAREQFGLVRRGDEPYAIIRPEDEPPEVPSVWPFNRVEDRLEP